MAKTKDSTPKHKRKGKKPETGKHKGDKKNGRKRKRTTGTAASPATTSGGSLKGRVAIVTGSTSGIGLGIARALAAQGCSVVLNGLGDSAAVEHERSSLENEFGVNVLFHGADMTVPEQIADMVSSTVKKLGAVDILVNNAGIQHTAAVEDFPNERWEQVITINLSAPFYAMKAAIPHMKKKGWGRIINIASVHGLVASVHKVAYVSAKHGLLGATKVAALENAESGITANAICPGWVRTPLVEKQIEALAQREGIPVALAAVKLLEEKQPSKQFVTVEQLGAAVVFLCSDAASGMTGVTLTLDGGWTAR